MLMDRVALADLLEKIVKYLMLSAGFVENPGIEAGKVGLVVFFYRYAQYADNENVMLFANELLDDLQQSVHNPKMNFRQYVCAMNT
jgi:hypothetical protein